MKPSSAAKAVAAEWQVAETTIFSDYSRHCARLSGDVGAFFMREHPDIADEFDYLVVREFSKHVETACKLDSPGDSVGFDIERDFDPVSADWDAFFDRLGLLLLDYFPNTKGR
ncbi:MAG: hypothetical protein Q8N48_00145 [Thiobacillus sp.]|nr:hypothetical protein [Thiobacillus sp.]MDP2977221.1 hypothetical protein [Thiobacillus sp.]